MEGHMSAARALTILALLTSACAVPSVQHQSRSTPRSALGTSREMIQADELRKGGDAGSLADILQLKRPHFLRTTGNTGRIDVFINGHYAGDIDVLRGILPRQVISVRKATRTEAYTMFAPSLNGDHVLFVTTAR